MSIELAIRDAISSVLTTAIPTLNVSPIVPKRIQRYNLPMAVIIPKQASYTSDSTDVTQIVRTWEIRTLVENLGNDLATTNEIAMYDFIENVQSALMARRNLEQTAFVDFNYMQRDSGFTEVQYGDNLFLGVIFEVQVTYARIVNQTK